MRPGDALQSPPRSRTTPVIPVGAQRRLSSRTARSDDPGRPHPAVLPPGDPPPRRHRGPRPDQRRRRTGLRTLLAEIERLAPGAILQQAATIELRRVGWGRVASRRHDRRSGRAATQVAR